MAKRRRSNRPRRPETNILFTTPSRRQQRQKLTRWALWLLILGCTLTAVGVGTHYAVESFLARALYRNPRYALKQIVVDAKGGIQRKQVIQASRLVVGQNTLSVDLSEVERNVERLPYVATAQVQRCLPDKIMIRVTERLPIARITSVRDDLNMRELLYIDRDGVAIKPQPNEPLRNVPEIVGGRFVDIEAGQHFEQPEIVAAINLIKSIELTSLRGQLDVARFDVSHPLAIEMTTREGTKVLFQMENQRQQLDRLQEILDFANGRDRQLASVDLTPERNVPVRFRNDSPNPTRVP